MKKLTRLAQWQRETLNVILDPTSVLLIVPDQALRRAIRARLQNAANLTCIGEMSDTAAAFERRETLKPAVIVLDFETLSGQSTQTLLRLSRAYPHSKILALSAHNDREEHLIVDLFRQGAWGYLDKDGCQPAEIIEAIRVVSKGQAVLSPTIAGRILNELSQLQKHQ